MAVDDSSLNLAAPPSAQPPPPPPLPPKDTEPPDAVPEQAAAAAEENSDAGASPAIPVPRRGWLRNSAAFLVSLNGHLILLVALGLWLIPTRPLPPISSLVVDMHPQPDEQPDVVELDQVIQAAVTFSSFGADPATGTAGAVTGMVSEPGLDNKIFEMTEAATDVEVSDPLADIPDRRDLIREMPEGQLGDPRAIVDNYDEAMDRITQEVLWMLAKQPVLLIWCFDQSESMEDDQREIEARVSRVYSELGLTGVTAGDALASAVTSFGEGFLNHTRRPTGDVQAIREAIASVPTDPSGKENMCQAILANIMLHQDYAKKGRRQMALIMVTDESGEKEDKPYLEPCIAAAKAARCRVYFLSREAVFGYPFAHMRWVHPFTKRVHWLPIDRGPETGFVEQLQTDGFRRRYDAHPSGFGPYEQARIARETGGIFFMLPSLETNLVRGEKRRYELEAMRSYRPDLSPRDELFRQRQASVLRSVLGKVIHDLNPYRPEVAEVMEARYHFSPRPAQFVVQARKEQEKARQYVVYLLAAAQALEDIRYHRDQEPSPRWQANYDLIYAQVLAYTARTYEYGAYLEHFIQNPKIVPLTKPPNHRLAEWRIRHSQAVVAGEQTSSLIERSAAMFEQVIQQHAGTPWAARAEWELARGFGFELHERYTAPSRPSPPRPTTPTIPIPKL